MGEIKHYPQDTQLLFPSAVKEVVGKHLHSKALSSAMNVALHHFNVPLQRPAKE